MMTKSDMRMLSKLRTDHQELHHKLDEIRVPVRGASREVLSLRKRLAIGLETLKEWERRLRAQEAALKGAKS